jgi:hypothetical protein
LLLIVTAFSHFVCNLLFTADNQPEDDQDSVSDLISPVDERQAEEEDPEEEDPEEEADEAPEEEDNILSITDNMSKMKVASSRYDMSARFPYVLMCTQKAATRSLWTCLSLEFQRRIIAQECEPAACGLMLKWKFPTCYLIGGASSLPPTFPIAALCRVTTTRL